MLRQHYKTPIRTCRRRSAGWTMRARSATRSTKEDSAKKAGAPVGRRREANPQAVREARDLDANIRRIAERDRSRDLEIQKSQKEMKRVNDTIKAYQGRIETVPLGEKQYADLLRDRDLAKDEIHRSRRGSWSTRKSRRTWKAASRAKRWNCWIRRRCRTTPTEPSGRW